MRRDFGVAVRERKELAMIAVQGPNGPRKDGGAAAAGTASGGARIEAVFRRVAFDSWFVARTGYTGEDGFEIMIPAADAADAWNRLRHKGVAPAGLGARDTLRLEAGMNLYGNDMDENFHPLESGLAWTVAFEPAAARFHRPRGARARAARGRPRAGGLAARGSRRAAQPSEGSASAAPRPRGSSGEVTSGTFSPTLNRSIALARVPKTSEPRVQVEIRGKPHAARIVKPPFVRHGKPMIDID